MNQPRKHADLIKLWADGSEIEEYCPFNKAWGECPSNPAWRDDVEYRVKPAPPTYGELANRAWSIYCDWNAVADAVIAEYKLREGGAVSDGEELEG